MNRALLIAYEPALVLLGVLGWAGWELWSLRRGEARTPPPPPSASTLSAPPLSAPPPSGHAPGHAVGEHPLDDGGA